MTPDNESGSDSSSDPVPLVSNEKPLHRLAAMLAARGQAAQEISEELGIPLDTFLHLQSQPTFQQRVLAEIKASGRPLFQTILNHFAASSLYQIAKLSMTAQSESVRLNASKEILALRLSPKPSADPLEDDESSLPDDPAVAVSHLDNQIEKARQRLNPLACEEQEEDPNDARCSASEGSSSNFEDNEKKDDGFESEDDVRLGKEWSEEEIT